MLVSYHGRENVYLGVLDLRAMFYFVHTFVSFVNTFDNFVNTSYRLPFVYEIIKCVDKGNQMCEHQQRETWLINLVL